jgi:septum site-determining protein MinC
MKQEEIIVFKGSKDGLWLVLNDEVDFSIVIDKLREKLRESADFFQGSKVIVNLGKRELQAVQYHEVSEVLQKEHGLILWRWDTGEKVEPVKPEVGEIPAHVCAYCRGIEPLVLYRTVRSGQHVMHEGSIVVLGDVNPGGALVAGGDIMVLGTCRGSAHAGVFGNERAVVGAYRLQPTQLRIANMIACAPDEAKPPACPEIARMLDGEVVIEQANLR